MNGLSGCIHDKWSFYKVITNNKVITSFTWHLNDLNKNTNTLNS